MLPKPMTQRLNPALQFIAAVLVSAAWFGSAREARAADADYYYVITDVQMSIGGTSYDFKAVGPSGLKWTLTRPPGPWPLVVQLDVTWERFGGGSNSHGAEHLPSTKVFLDNVYKGQAKHPSGTFAKLVHTNYYFPSSGAHEIRLVYETPDVTAKGFPSTVEITKPRIKLGWNKLVIETPAEGQAFSMGDEIPLSVNILSGQVPIHVAVEWQRKVGGAWLGSYGPYPVAWAQLPQSVPVTANHFPAPGQYRVRIKDSAEPNWTGWRTILVQ